MSDINIVGNKNVFSVSLNKINFIGFETDKWKNCFSITLFKNIENPHRSVVVSS